MAVLGMLHAHDLYDARHRDEVVVAEGTVERVGRP